MRRDAAWTMASPSSQGEELMSRKTEPINVSAVLDSLVRESA
jgi:hypothetical protein